jgi:hypothetical protein
MQRLWTIRHPKLAGTELFQLIEDGPKRILRGWVVAMVERVGCAIHYEVSADEQWVTRRVDIKMESSAGSSLVIEHDGQGKWSVDGEIHSGLNSCLDVDLGISPSTNTLPIRRLRLGVGESQDLTAAWVRFPDLTVEVLSQRYEKTAESIYRYQSDSFQADLDVDEHGVVLRYGHNLWQVVDRG